MTLRACSYYLMVLMLVGCGDQAKSRRDLVLARPKRLSHI